MKENKIFQQSIDTKSSDTVLLKQGDDLLDYRVSEHYFRQQQVANIIVEADGDHRMSDFFIKIPQVIHFLFGLNMPYE